MTKRSLPLFDSRGFTLPEAMLASAIVVVIIFSSFGLAPVLWLEMRKAGAMTQATFTTQNMIEMIRSQPQPYQTAPLYHQFDTRDPVPETLPQPVKDTMEAWKEQVAVLPSGWGFVEVEPANIPDAPALELLQVTATVRWGDRICQIVTYIAPY